ncbi:MAG TPA: hypothetical protein VLS89_20710 [Candidatus Nanopelagicales bacterium]|nr:hypothetical protein [Candidatus Nanopelagicales bacterium]
MPDPPDPHVGALLLATIAKLGWRVLARDVTGTELGELVSDSDVRPLVLARGDAAGTVQWRIVDALPPRTAAWLLSRETFEILSGATPNDDGSITFRDQRYRVIVDYSGQHNIATAIRV